MDKDAYRDLKRMAIDEDTTVNELMVRAINELRERKGLKKLAS
ncbi:MAG: ribbon-helix-helix domain-containing protein [Steroidobacteraceae bacterium]